MTHDNDPAHGSNPHPSNDSGAISPPSRAPVLPPRDPSAAPHSADHLTTLAHDLSNLIDGSMRWLSLAITKIEPNTPDPNEQLDTARQQINTVQATLHRMSTMVNAAMRSNTIAINSPLLGVSESVSTAMAIDHAVDVVRPLASQSGVRIDMSINPEAGTIAAGPLYTVILNALFNAIQSIQRATQTDALDPGGLITIAATLDNKHDELVITVTDDGVGLTPGTNPELPFKHTHTSTGRPTGIGLSIARQIIDQLEGVITLTNRTDTNSTRRPGAILTARVPVPQPNTDLDRTIG